MGLWDIVEAIFGWFLAIGLLIGILIGVILAVLIVAVIHFLL